MMVCERWIARTENRFWADRVVRRETYLVLVGRFECRLWCLGPLNRDPLEWVQLDSLGSNDLFFGREVASCM